MIEYRYKYKLIPSFALYCTVCMYILWKRLLRICAKLTLHLEMQPICARRYELSQILFLATKGHERRYAYKPVVHVPLRGDKLRQFYYCGLSFCSSERSLSSLRLVKRTNEMKAINLLREKKTVGNSYNLYVSEVRRHETV